MEPRGSVNHDNHTLMVKNIPRHFSESEVRGIFMRNPMDGVWACNSNGRRNPVTNASEPIEGQFFVNFLNADLASEACQQWNGQVIGQNQIRVEFKTLRLGQPSTRPSQHDEALWMMRVHEWERAKSQPVVQVTEVFPARMSPQRKASAEFRASAPEFIPQSQVPKQPSTNVGSSTVSSSLSLAVGSQLPGRFTVPPTTLPSQDMKGKRSKTIGHSATSSDIVAPMSRSGHEENRQVLRKVKTFSTEPSTSQVTSPPGMPAIMRPQDLELTWKWFEYSVLGGERPHNGGVLALLKSLPLLMVD